MSSEFLDRYFPGVREYGDPVEIMMEPGTLISYIATTFLNGWINYVKVVSAFLVTRYQGHDRNAAAAEAFNTTTSFHTDAATGLQDDVTILARPEHANEWWFFYSDRDVSDCQIGRFQTDDTPEQVLELFERHARTCSRHNADLGAETAPPIKLLAGAFHGWIKL